MSTTTAHNAEGLALPDLHRPPLGSHSGQEPQLPSLSPDIRDHSNQASLHLSAPPIVPFPRQLPFWSKMKLVKKRFYLLGALGWDGVVNFDPSGDRDCVRCRGVWIVTTRVDTIDILATTWIMTTVCDNFWLHMDFEFMCNILAPFVPNKCRMGPAQAREAEHKYVVVGIIHRNRTTPLETLRYVTRDAGLFKQIYIATLIVRPPKRQWLSLKHITGFGIYKCHPTEDYHTTIDYDSATKRALAELFKDYQSRFWTFEDHGDRWMNWIHAEFNNSDADPRNGTYSLQLVLGWSVPKLIFWGTAPVVLSLVVGLWYMLTPQPGADYVAVVQTAWTIASYIVTSAALAIGILAAVTQLADT
ncbi:hypothetical protein GLAREA_10392 [Glarea lozoyensis ATCC 20868]|uniref:Uncharacterized protein n=1 Tax=Glarea lozoyensis (strain ATCC 20868 / MF5171) TaxID=1116229 RepID=S3E8S8_GLAL2|nr:uncharacterized protein GLAREA_10392 [Glarea lozoyensis ATCC 20868]EPE34698.1 hypothetical protein GLAREA_10392 [Glarea lozoyensis ATCC 20868]